MAHPLMFNADDPALERIRRLALALPGAEETNAHGPPWFKAGRGFAIYGGGTKGPDRVPHPRALLVRIDPEELLARRQDTRFVLPAYVGPNRWLGIDVDAPDVDWIEIRELLEASYRLQAPASPVRQLDAR